MDNQFEHFLNLETINSDELQDYILTCDLFDGINEDNIEKYIEFSKKFLNINSLQFIYMKIQQLYLNLIENPEISKLYYKYIAITINNSNEEPITKNENLIKLMNMVRIRGYDSDIVLVSYYYGMDIIKKLDELKKDGMSLKTFEFYKDNVMKVYNSLINTNALEEIAKEFNEFEDELIKLGLISTKKNPLPNKSSFLRNIFNKKGSQ